MKSDYLNQMNFNELFTSINYISLQLFIKHVVKRQTSNCPLTNYQTILFNFFLKIGSSLIITRS